MKVRTLLSAFAALGLVALAAAGVGAWTSSAVGANNDPLPTVTQFVLESDGNRIASFGDLELSSVAEASQVQVGQKVVAVPSTRTSTGIAATVTLRRGMSSDTAMWVWHELAQAGDAS